MHWEDFYPKRGSVARKKREVIMPVYEPVALETASYDPLVEMANLTDRLSIQEIRALPSDLIGEELFRLDNQNREIDVWWADNGFSSIPLTFGDFPLRNSPFFGYPIKLSELIPQNQKGTININWHTLMSKRNDSHGRRVHRGIDILAPIGSKIYAPFDLKVIDLVSWDGSRNSGGNYMVVEDVTLGRPLGLALVMMHLSKFKVQEGQIVKKGDLIALSGDTGTSADHLHLECWWFTKLPVLSKKLFSRNDCVCFPPTQLFVMDEYPENGAPGRKVLHHW